MCSYDVAAETSGPGKSACAYYGAQDVNCQMTVVPVSQLPDSCTSIVYDGVLLNSRNEICDANGADYSGNSTIFWYFPINLSVG